MALRRLPHVRAVVPRGGRSRDGPGQVHRGDGRVRAAPRVQRHRGHDPALRAHAPAHPRPSASSSRWASRARHGSASGSRRRATSTSRNAASPPRTSPPRGEVQQVQDGALHLAARRGDARPGTRCRSCTSTWLAAVRTHGHCFEAFKQHGDDPDRDPRRVAAPDGSPRGDAAVKEALVKDIRRRMTPQPLKIRADVELTCFAYDGVMHIKDAMRAALAKSGNPEEGRHQNSREPRRVAAVRRDVLDPGQGRGVALVDERWRRRRRRSRRRAARW